MKTKHILQAAGIAFIALCISSCKEAAPAKDTMVTPAGAPAAITNPRFSIAPEEYSSLSEKAINHVGNFEFDAWGEMLADDVEFSFPDGDVDTRTKLVGKPAVLAWWKALKANTGIESMSMSEFNHFPINVTEQPKGGAATGIYDFCYFSNKTVIKGKPLAIRMNYVTHFNSDKKIDRYVTYYDRTALVQAIGKNLLAAPKTK